jgi:hypothetical protein
MHLFSLSFSSLYSAQYKIPQLCWVSKYTFITRGRVDNPGEGGNNEQVLGAGRGRGRSSRPAVCIIALNIMMFDFAIFVISRIHPSRMM